MAKAKKAAKENDEVAAVSVDGQALGTTGYSKCEYRARPS